MCILLANLIFPPEKLQITNGANQNNRWFSDPGYDYKTGFSTECIVDTLRIYNTCIQFNDTFSTLSAMADPVHMQFAVKQTNMCSASADNSDFT